MIKENIVVYQRGEQKGTPQMKTYDVELHLCVQIQFEQQNLYLS